MKISARNQLKGKITEISIGTVMAKVVINIGGDIYINSIITVDSVTSLDLKLGDIVYAVIKSTEVMIGTE
jgi:molybdopterin-binding protein